MNYFSTRGGIFNVKFKDAVMMGMAEDGGLLLPSEFPSLDIDKLKGKSYVDVAFEVLKGFAGDIDSKDFYSLLASSYSSFSTPDVVPLVNIKECYLAELFHGPTYAFKDIALQFLGNLFEYILSQRKEKLNIIGATSGDTGSAAIYGVRGKNNIKIAILYPNGRVSPVQELQMTSVDDINVSTLAVEGTFDDCQNYVKEYFADIDFKKKYNLGSVNSINWARIMAQIVYYVYSYLQLNYEGKVNFVVPTGNFGNIFAGYCAMNMGVPIEKLVLATNENDILHRFISNGDYSLREVKQTHSPSMDIQLASNFERYLYFLYGKNSLKVKSAMEELKLRGKIIFSEKEIAEVKRVFSSYGANDIDTESAIKRVYENCGYIIDPHTACGVEAANALGLDQDRTIVLATAHPAKFKGVVEKVLNITVAEPEGLEALHGKKSRKELIANDSGIIQKRLIELFN